MFDEREIVPKKGPGWEQPWSWGSCHCPISCNVWENCLCSPWYYCTVLSPFLLSHCSCYCCSPWIFPPFFPPFYFFPSFCLLGLICCPFFLSVSIPRLFPPLFLACSLSFSACYTLPFLGKALVWYHITDDPGISGRRAEADGQPVRLCVPSLCPPSSRILQLWEPG